jgi:4,4'-dithiodibutanoate disulfide reductase
MSHEDHPVSTGVSPFAPAQLGPLTLRNRIIKAATFEGVMPNGAVTNSLIEFHRLVARGGAAMTTLAYCAISPGGRVNRNTLVMSDDILVDLRRLTDAVHNEGAAIAAQLGHAGLVADVRSNGHPTLAPSGRLSAPAMSWVRGATVGQLDDIVDQFGHAATVAITAGFDAIELHLGHNYLLSSFLSPNLNSRRDEYGGGLDNRLRLSRRVIDAVRATVGSSVALTAKFNMADGVPDGLWLDESLEFASMLEADGQLDALELSGGSSLLNAMYYFRGDVPLAEFIATQPRIVGWGLKLFGKRIFPELPFEEAFFLPLARQFRQKLSMPLILLGGINQLDTIEHALGEGFDFVAMARALLRDPDLPNKMRDDRHSPGLCIHCNKCVPTIYTGTRCVLTAPRPHI